VQPTILTYMAEQDKVQDSAIVAAISEADGRSCVVHDWRQRQGVDDRSRWG